jgi:hypothetical protein
MPPIYLTRMTGPIISKTSYFVASFDGEDHELGDLLEAAGKWLKENRFHITTYFIRVEGIGGDHGVYVQVFYHTGG